jgi:predicted transcriptional regulator
MKSLYERGLVIRDDANKPYTYQLTDEGRRYIQ